MTAHFAGVDCCGIAFHWKDPEGSDAEEGFVAFLGDGFGGGSGVDVDVGIGGLGDTVGTADALGTGGGAASGCVLAAGSDGGISGGPTGAGGSDDGTNEGSGRGAT